MTQVVEQHRVRQLSVLDATVPQLDLFTPNNEGIRSVQFSSKRELKLVARQSRGHPNSFNTAFELRDPSTPAGLKTLQAYESMVGAYDLEAQRFWRKFPPGFINTYRSYLPPNSRVLNIGSGPGWDSQLLAQAGLEVICLDASTNMTLLSHDRGFTSVQADFRRIPFEKGSFKGAWAYTSLIHVPKTEFVQALAEIRETLVPDGILGLGMLRGNSEHFSLSYGLSNPRYTAYYTKPELINALTFAGFELVDYEKMQRVGTKTGTYHNIIARRLDN